MDKEKLNHLKLIGGISMTLLAKKRHYVNDKELATMVNVFVQGYKNFGKEEWLKILKRIISDLLNKKLYNEVTNVNKILLKTLYATISHNPLFALTISNKSVRFDPIFLFDKERERIRTERIPRVDIYNDTRKEIVKYVSDIHPVIIRKDIKKSKIDKRNRIHLFLPLELYCIEELLIYASQCSDGLVMDIEILRDERNLLVLKNNRDKFRYVILYGDRDDLMARRITRELTC